MATKTASVNNVKSDTELAAASVKRLVTLMTIFAWTALTVGVLLCLIKISHFSDKNTTLMVGVGFLVGSVFIYTIGTAIALVHARLQQAKEDEPNDDQSNHIL
ncbi:hypothetical protein [Paenibacillus glycanilyticus]|uniref:Uncharacterized protein n=1 Tax=Paenibacillus glycanilyticus TaxID=126569 RepID=A0ABQ6GM72_9BACL|nr:hypothetical protein [Paenibacillus glycanilyticus]GLX71345.1 hypothetical protein MU1_56950 [Paenibacillus glycanilyticus]